MKNQMVMLGFLFVIVKPMSVNTVPQNSDNCRTNNVRSDTKTRQTVYSAEEYDYDYYTYEILYNYAICWDSSLRKGVPLSISKQNISLKYITFQRSVITVVPIGVFDKFDTLNELYLNSSAVNMVHPGAFKGLDHLNELYLQHNQINKISQGIFNSLGNLKILNLAFNHIEIIEEHAFLGLLALQYLYLSYNKIISIVPNTFQDTYSLVYTDLSHNSKHLNNMSENYVTIDFGVFASSTTHLNLSSNYINSFNNLSRLSHLFYLDLSNNSLFHMEDISLKFLLYLNLSQNLIPKLGSPLQRLPLLTYLDLSYNVISSLTIEIFANMHVLQHLLIQNNLLESIPVGCFKDLSSLKILNISSNNISEIHFGTFEGMHNLIMLDISNNNIAQLDEGIFNPLENISFLNIAHNKLIKIHPLYLVDHVQTLKFIVLNNNPWDCVYLSSIIFTFKKANVTVVKGPTHYNTHLRGIQCTTRNTTTATVNFEDSLSNASLYNYSRDILSIQYFNETFHLFLNVHKKLSEELSNLNKQLYDIANYKPIPLKPPILASDKHSDREQEIVKLLRNLNHQENEFRISSTTNIVFISIVLITLIAVITLLLLKHLNRCEKKSTSNIDNISSALNNQEIELI